MADDVQNRWRALKARMRLPIAAAPMFLVSGPDLVMAARRAGLLASFPFPNARELETLDAWLGKCCAPGLSAPFAANMVTHSTYGRFDAELALIAKHRPEIVITALGGPRRVVETVHAYGGLVFADVNSIVFAKKALDAGADGLVLVSAGAGGHTGDMAGFAFVAEVRRFFDGPIMLGGAIGDGRAARAAEVLGADIAYLGTRFITATESLASDLYREMVVAAEFADLVRSKKLTGADAYYLRASLERMGLLDAASGKEAPDFGDGDEVKAWRDVWSAGHGVGGVTSIEPTAAIVDRLERDYRAACAAPSFDTQWTANDGAAAATAAQ